MKSKITTLFPFAIFLITFILLHAVYQHASIAKDNFAIFAAFIALIFSFFTFPENKKLNEKVEVLVEGLSQNIVLHMSSIFYLSTVFTSVLEKIGGITAAVNICLQIIPTWSILPGIFMVTSIFSFAVGTSMGAIVAFMPIAHSIATTIQLHPSLMAATVVCGAMFGDNLSILSDTTIAAVKVCNANMKDKLILNSKIAAPAFFISIAILFWQNYHSVSCNNLNYQTTFHLIDCIKITPYLLTLCLAITGLDIIIVLVCGIILSCMIGIQSKSLYLFDVINIWFDGFYTNKGMVNVTILVMLLAGLSHIIAYNGGLNYLIEKLKKFIRNKQQAQYMIFVVISLINAMIAINTISILITGPIAKKINDDYKIDPTKTATILDIGSCISQGILPYTPQLLLAASIAQISPISLLPYLYYQYLLTVCLILTFI
ncbi:MAG: Na+/H+ antiporter NhaC family protein [Candidatus Chromulinivorax sp.]